MKFGVNQYGINYFIVKRNEFFCTYYSEGLNIEVTIKDVVLSYIERLTINDLLKYNNEVINK
jgi:hypothetical protein